jgi:hypothetical protein
VLSHCTFRHFDAREVHCAKSFSRDVLPRE